MDVTTLSNGVKMPMEGFGIFQVPDAAVCEQAVSDALETGYRLIDTAAAYFNEEAVGRAVKKSSVPREDLLLQQNCGFRMPDMKMQKKHFRFLLISWEWIMWICT